MLRQRAGKATPRDAVALKQASPGNRAAVLDCEIMPPTSNPYGGGVRAGKLGQVVMRPRDEHSVFRRTRRVDLDH